jgi:hypothetical protein
MKSRFKIILISLLCFCLALLPVAAVVTLAFTLPAQYSNTFVGVLDEKFERLTSIKEDKVIVVGGSSVAFGLDSEAFEAYTGVPVVNFGLYAALGTKLMLDMSKAGIEDGDVVVIAPELDRQTLSLYFNTETTLQAMDDDMSLIRYASMDNFFSLISGMFRHVSAKIEYMRSGAPNPEGVYNASSFNEYGDVSYERKGNTMELYYDPNTPIKLDESILDDSFIEYLNDYIGYCRSRGASVYFSFCPMNAMAVTDKSAEALSAFEQLLSERLDCELISYAEDYIMDPGYFFDSNFHLNDVGVKYRTLRLAKDVMLATGNTALVTEKFPEPPEINSGLIMLEEFDENEKYFTYTELPNGNMMITGLTELGRVAEELTVPKSVRVAGTNYSIAVTAIGARAFDGAKAKTVNIKADSYVAQLMNDAFSGASYLRVLNIYITDATKILPPASFSGMRQGFAVHVPKNTDYTTDYFWSQIKVTIVSDLYNYDK